MVFRVIFQSIKCILLPSKFRESQWKILKWKINVDYVHNVVDHGGKSNCSWMCVCVYGKFATEKHLLRAIHSMCYHYSAPNECIKWIRTWQLAAGIQHATTFVGFDPKSNLFSIMVLLTQLTDATIAWQFLNFLLRKSNKNALWKERIKGKKSRLKN